MTLQRLESAHALLRQGRLLESENILRGLLSEQPRDDAALNLLAVIADRVGQRELAVDYVQRALDQRPDHGPYLANLGALYQKLGRTREAVDICRRAAALAPQDATVRYNLGNALRDSGDANAAAQAFRTAIRLRPDYAAAYTNLGELQWRGGDVAAAVAHYEAALRLAPSAAAHNNLAAVLTDADRFDLAERHARVAVDLLPRAESAGACNNLGVALQYQGRLEEAESRYREALEVDPGYAECHHNLFWVLMLQGRLEEGWREHAWRGRVFPGSLLDLPVATWRGEALRGASVVVYAEQGIGDEIMFASCLPDLAARGARCAVQCDARLAPLFARSFAGVRVIGGPRDAAGAPWRRALETADFQAPAGDLPHFLRQDESGFGAGAAYLVPDAAQVERWRERLRSLGPGLKVGIAWKGGSRPKDRRRRSLPLAQWSPILAAAPVHFVSVQYGDAGEEVAAAAPGTAVHRFEDLDAYADLDGLAAALSALDLVVSVDNATVHLAGALGVPTWAMVPFVPDWRWFLGRDTTPWYASVELFRQPAAGEWEPCVARVAQRLAERAARHREGAG